MSIALLIVSVAALAGSVNGILLARRVSKLEEHLGLKKN